MANSRGHDERGALDERLAERLDRAAVAADEVIGIGEVSTEAHVQDAIGRRGTGAQRVEILKRPLVRHRPERSQLAGRLLRASQSGHFPTQTRDTLLETVTEILAAGIAAGTVRADANADDVTASMLGILTVAGAPSQRVQAGRLLDLLMDGLRTRH
jgi:hypothetical protein